MADDVMKPREPGEKGGSVGQIQTPMCDTNIGDKGEGKVHSYKDITKGATGSGGADIMGPGENANWDTQISIKGSNKPGRY